MSEGAIEPSAVYPPGGAPIRTGRQNFYQTYNTRTLPDPVGGDSSGGGFNYQGGFIHRTMSRVPNGSGPYVSVPSGIPKFLGSRPLLFFAWGIAMVMVSLDEWHTNHILPRPARLWYTSLTFFLMALVSTVDAMVPITNALAIGFIIMLGMQYYTGTGQFGPFGAEEVAGQNPNATSPTANQAAAPTTPSNIINAQGQPIA